MDTVFWGCTEKGCSCVVLLKVCTCVCVLATYPATLDGLFWSSIYCLVIWSLSFSLHSNFLCPCVTKISLYVRVNHLSYAHAPLRKGQGCHLAPAALLSYLCVSYSRPLAASRLGNLSTLFIPIRTNNKDIKCSFTSAKTLPQIKRKQHTSLFVWIIKYIN